MIDAQELFLVKSILWVVGSSVVALLVLHFRAARGNVQISRYEAELRLDREDRSSWRTVVETMRMEVDGRLRSLEETVKHVPTSSEFAELEGKVEGVVIRQTAMAEGQQAIRESLRRIEDYLLNGKRS